MLTEGHDGQILRCVVVLIAVNVVNPFPFDEITSKRFLDDQNMFLHVPAVIPCPRMPLASYKPVTIVILKTFPPPRVVGSAQEFVFAVVRTKTVLC